MGDTMLKDAQLPGHVVIVGGSLAGLMHGIMLKRMGCNVTILEKDSDYSGRRPHSAGIGFGTHLGRFLNLYDLTRSRASIVMPGIQISWRKHVGIWHAPVHRQLTSWALLYRILRANLDGMASKACPHPPKALKGDGQATYRASACVYEVEPSPDRQCMVVYFNDPATGKSDSLNADLVIGADGINSSLRRMLQPSITPKYSGYVVWRAMVQESDVSAETARFFAGGAATELLKDSYVVVYIVPTDDGCFEPGKRWINWLWYYNVADGSDEMNQIFTDATGHRHKNTVPAGMVQSEVWEYHRNTRLHQMAPPFRDLITATRNPFVSKVNDLLGTRNSFYDGRVVLVGDAFTTIRPHLARATEHAAWQCLCMAEIWTGGLSHKAWSREVATESEKVWLTSRLMGLFGQSHWLALAKSLGSYLLFFIRRRLRRS
ncbi:FAD binding domain protein [Xylariomycetidae sp. FL0641]|nr:FAD binding domain protein [Xylariomycetidae sp. FL0641]